MLLQRNEIPVKAVLLFTLLAAALDCTTAHGQLHTVALLEAIPEDSIIQGRSALEKWEQQAASEGSWKNAILGNTCFTTAISQMKQGCTKMDSTNRCWLAIQFTVCFQRASGFKPLDCPTVCPRYKRLQTCVEDCTAKMDQNTYTTYTHFFSDVFNMCLFLQTQNFQEWTSALVQDMHLQTASANASLGTIKSQLANQHEALQESLQALASLHTVQLKTAEAAQAGLTEVKAVGKLSLGLQQSMNESLQLTDKLSSHQNKLMQGFSELETQQKQQAEQTIQAWQQLAANAAALEQRQVRYETLQLKLLDASEGLLNQSAGMTNVLDLLVHYQQTGSSLLSSLHNSSTTLQDLMFYLVALAVPLLFLTHPPEARLLLLLAVLSAWISEKVVLQNVVPLHYAFAGGIGTKAPVYFQTVKLGVRFAVMGGGGALVLWLMLKRQAARQRKEQVYEELRKLFDEAAAFPPAYHVPPHAPGAPTAVHPQQPTMPAEASPNNTRTGRGKSAHLPTRAARLMTDALMIHPNQQQEQPDQQQQQQTYAAMLQHYNPLAHMMPYHHAAAVTPFQLHHPAAVAQPQTHNSQQLPTRHSRPVHSGQQRVLLPAAGTTVGAPTIPTDGGNYCNVDAPEGSASDMDYTDTSEHANDPPVQQQVEQPQRRGRNKSKATTKAAAVSSTAAAKAKPKAAGAKRGRGKAAIVNEDTRQQDEEEEQNEPALKQAALSGVTGRRAQRRRR